MQNDDFQTQLLKHGIDLGFLMAGFFGALILAIRKKKQSIGKSLACIFVGMMSANYLTPLILSFSPPTLQEKWKYTVAFVMGYMGLKGIEFIVDVLVDHIKSKKS